MNKKYELTDDSKINLEDLSRKYGTFPSGGKMYIASEPMALTSRMFPGCYSSPYDDGYYEEWRARCYDEAGDRGGWIESERNLSQVGSAWESGEAQVRGEARVVENAVVSGEARVFGKARVGGAAWVSGSAVVGGHAQVDGRARVGGEARVGGISEVTDCSHVSEGARVFGRAVVRGRARGRENKA